MIIGIAGKKGSGKTTFAGYLAEGFGERGYTARITSFATPLYKILSALDGRSVEWLKANKNASTWVGGGTVREALQQLGTEVFRTFHPNVWVMALDIRISTHGITIIDDVRFVNEAEYIKQGGGYLIRLRRNEGVDTHQSEIDLDGYVGFDVEIDNSGTKDELRARAMQVYSDLS